LQSTINALDAYSGRWAIAGGWAIDLFLERTTRPHADVDVAVSRDQQQDLRNDFPLWDFRVVIDGEFRPWAREQRIEAPLHEIHAITPAGTIELLLNERRGEQWVYRRDSRIERPLERAIVHIGGVPVLAPEIALLFKSKDPRPTDDADLANAMGHLTAEAREWLAAALELSAPGHWWIEFVRVGLSPAADPSGA
jgi:hypothetical protein